MTDRLRAASFALATVVAAAVAASGCGSGGGPKAPDGGTGGAGSGGAGGGGEGGAAAPDAALDATPDAALDGPGGSLMRTGGFSPGRGNLCGLGYDYTTRTVWIYPCSGASLLAYAPDGTPGATISRPGESADDVDIDVAPAALALGTTPIAAGTLLFVNGETGTVDVHAVDPAAAMTPLATLATQFGVSHVVGGAFHLGRSTFFAVQDRVPGAPAANTVGEIDPASGAVIATFSLLPNFDVNYGDIDVCQSTGQLFVVSDSADSIAELTPAGVFVRAHPLPADVSGLSGIGIDDDISGDAWVSSRGGAVSRLGGFPCPPLP